MSFYNIYNNFKDFDLNQIFNNVSDAEIKGTIYSDRLTEKQFVSLLSNRAKDHIEEMAQVAHEKTIKYFGKTIQLYTPMYLSSYCDNNCIYCGFNVNNKIERKRLTIKEVQSEAEFIASSGLKHVLILTGSSRRESPVSYIKECIEVLKKYFSSISLEVYAMEEDEYKELIDVGADGLTIYQEVYDQDIYKTLHLGGPKSNYEYRLGAPERAAKSGMRAINIGALLGCASWEKEIFTLAMHAKYLQDTFSSIEIGISLPRLRPQLGEFEPLSEVKDIDIVQIIIALRIFLPRIGITLSTRENKTFRDNLLPLGITRMSAGSTTAVGGHTSDDNNIKKDVQFEIFDKRDVFEMKELLKTKGYQPVLQDWILL